MNTHRIKGELRTVLRMFFIFLPLASFITLIHESGHWVWAYVLGLEPVIHFGHVSYEKVPELTGISDDVRKLLYYAAIGGPLQNFLIGSLAFGYFVIRVSRKPLEYPLGFYDWMLIYFVLLWARQIYIGFFGVLSLVFGFEYKADEVWIAGFLNWPEWSIFIPLGAVGSIVGLVVLYYFPSKYRVHFIAGGGSGALVGMGLWYGLVGPLILP